MSASHQVVVVEFSESPSALLPPLSLLSLGLRGDLLHPLQPLRKSALRFGTDWFVAAATAARGGCINDDWTRRLGVLAGLDPVANELALEHSNGSTCEDVE